MFTNSTQETKIVPALTCRIFHSAFLPYVLRISSFYQQPTLYSRAYGQRFTCTLVYCEIKFVIARSITIFKLVKFKFPEREVTLTSSDPHHVTHSKCSKWCRTVYWEAGTQKDSNCQVDGLTAEVFNKHYAGDVNRLRLTSSPNRNLPLPNQRLHHRYRGIPDTW